MMGFPSTRPVWIVRLWLFFELPLQKLKKVGNEYQNDTFATQLFCGPWRKVTKKSSKVHFVRRNRMEVLISFDKIDRSYSINRCSGGF